MTHTPPPQFGINIDPAAGDLEDPFRRAAVADRAGLDLITIQDHPYNRGMLETWTLLSMLAARTERVHLATNVANTPLRPPAMLAKQAATLDLLSGGRVELGLGAGAFWQGITAYGVEKRAPAEAYAAFEEALHIVRGMLDNAGGSFRYDGAHYRVDGARPGPGPAHRVPIWVGAIGPKMQRLTGRAADGILLSNSYVPREQLAAVNARLDDAAEQAGRAPSDVRRGYNLMGAIAPDRASLTVESGLLGPAAQWVETIVALYHDYRQDTFTFWPVAGDELRQIEVFALEVVPAVREALGHPAQAAGR